MNNVKVDLRGKLPSIIRLGVVVSKGIPASVLVAEGECSTGWRIGCITSRFSIARSSTCGWSFSGKTWSTETLCRSVSICSSVWGIGIMVLNCQGNYHIKSKLKIKISKEILTLKCITSYYLELGEAEQVLAVLVLSDWHLVFVTNCPKNRKKKLRNKYKSSST